MRTQLFVLALLVGLSLAEFDFSSSQTLYVQSDLMCSMVGLSSTVGAAVETSLSGDLLVMKGTDVLGGQTLYCNEISFEDYINQSKATDVKTKLNGLDPTGIFLTYNCGTDQDPSKNTGDNAFSLLIMLGKYVASATFSKTLGVCITVLGETKDLKFEDITFAAATANPENCDKVYLSGDSSFSFVVDGTETVGSNAVGKVTVEADLLKNSDKEYKDVTLNCKFGFFGAFISVSNCETTASTPELLTVTMMLNPLQQGTIMLTVASESGICNQTLGSWVLSVSFAFLLLFAIIFN